MSLDLSAGVFQEEAVLQFAIDIRQMTDNYLDNLLRVSEHDEKQWQRCLQWLSNWTEEIQVEQTTFIAGAYPFIATRYSWLFERYLNSIKSAVLQQLNPENQRFHFETPSLKAYLAEYYKQLARIIDIQKMWYFNEDEHKKQFIINTAIRNTLANLCNRCILEYQVSMLNNTITSDALHYVAPPLSGDDMDAKFKSSSAVVSSIVELPKPAVKPDVMLPLATPSPAPPARPAILSATKKVMDINPAPPPMMK